MNNDLFGGFDEIDFYLLVFIVNKNKVVFLGL